MRYCRPTLVGTCLGIALTLAACGNGPDASTAQPSTPATTAAPAQSPGPAATAAARNLENTTGALRALQAATKAVPQGRVSNLDRERRDGRLVWLVEVAGTRQRQFTLAVTADGTRLLTRRQSAHPDLDDLQEARAARITAARAANLASRRHPGDLDELDLDTTDTGTLVWRADLDGPDGAPVLVTLDARTGAVVTTPDE